MWFESSFLVAEYNMSYFHWSNIIHCIYNLLIYRILMHQMTISSIYFIPNQNHSGYPAIKKYLKGGDVRT